jgi:hypothetical protein
LRNRYVPILYQPHGFKLELPSELSSWHCTPPVPSSTPYLGVHGTGSRPDGRNPALIGDPFRVIVARAPSRTCRDRRLVIYAEARGRR